MRSGHAVLDRGAFLEELGVGDDREPGVREAARGQLVGHHGPHAVGRSHRHGALVDDDLVVGHVAADAACGGQHVLHVGRAVLVGRRAHADELQRAVRDRGGDVGRELQPARRAVARDDLVQPRLVDRDAALVEDADLARVDVQADHVVAHFGEAGAGDEADVAGADDGDFHGAIIPQGPGRDRSEPSVTNGELRPGGGGPKSGVQPHGPSVTPLPVHCRALQNERH
jgi:hypothetical protein